MLKLEYPIKKRERSLQFVPVQLETLLTTNKKIEWKGKYLKTSYLMDILHSLIMKYHFTEKKSYRLNAEILRKKYGTFYNYYMDYLLSKKILSRGANYYVGKQSRTYELPEQLIEGDFKRYWNSDKFLLKKYNNNFQFQLDQGGIKKDIKLKMVDDLYHINLDWDRAKLIVDNIEKKDSKEKNLFAINTLKGNDIFYHFDSFGRMHTNFTVLKTEIRDTSLLIEGESTDEVDISNSQPLFLYNLYKETGGSISEEAEQWVAKLLKYNKFYEYLMMAGNIKSRKKAKKVTYKVLFGKNKEYDKENELFRSCFPEWWSWIKNWKGTKKHYSELSHELQKRESNFLYNNVIKDIIDYNPNIKMFTVHDSITCKKTYISDVRRIFNEHIIKILPK